MEPETPRQGLRQSNRTIAADRFDCLKFRFSGGDLSRRGRFPVLRSRPLHRYWTCASQFSLSKGTMAQRTDKVLSNSDKNSANKAKVMTDAFYAQNILKEAFPEQRYGSVKGAIYAAYRFISPKVTKDITERRIRSIRDGTARRIDAEEMEALRVALIEEARREQNELRTRLAALDKKVAAFDARVSREAMARSGE